MDLFSMLAHAPVLHVLIGGFGGLLYLLRQYLKGYVIKAREFYARPIFGAVSALLFNAALGFPEHNVAFCTFVGYFGVDVWDALADKFKAKLPLAGAHEKAPEPPQSDDSDEQPRLPL